METIGNVVYWNLENCSLSMTNLENARLSMIGAGDKSELHMTNIDHATLKWITEAILFHATMSEEFKKINITLEKLSFFIEKNNNG